MRATHSFPPDRRLACRRRKPKNPSKTTTRDEFLTAMRATFKRIGARLYRRDLTEAESKKSWRTSRSASMTASRWRLRLFDKLTDLMTSPDFLCVIEQPGKLYDFALASRLAYFLWNSTPDETLLDLARQGQACRPEGPARADRAAAERSAVAALRQRLRQPMARPAHASTTPRPIAISIPNTTNC